MSTTNFYRLLADPSATSRWHLKAPQDSSGTEIDPRSFTQGAAIISPPALTVPLRRKGIQVDFNFGDFDMVVTPSALNAELADLVGTTIQRIPVQIDTRAGEFEILNVLDLLECIDEAKSQFTKWTHADGRPDKIGEYRMITRLRIHAPAADGHHLFRLRSWPIALIASEAVKQMFENRKVSGLTFDAVT